MVERVFDATIPLYLVPLPSSSSILSSSSTRDVNFGINTVASQDGGGMSNQVLPSGTLMNTHLPTNFWLIATNATSSNIPGSTAYMASGVTTSPAPCMKKNLLVQLDRGKKDGQRWMAIVLLDPADPLFYYEHKLDEEAYGKMRVEQQILVPFDSFAEQLAAFLKAASFQKEPPGPASPPKLAVCLAIPQSSNSALFQIVETSSFKHIVHVSLQVELLSDEAMKRRLASLVINTQNEIVAAKARLSDTIRDTETFTHSITAERDALKAALDNLSSSLERLGREGDGLVGTESPSVNLQLVGPLAEKLSLLKKVILDRDAQTSKIQEMEMALKEKEKNINSLTMTVSQFQEESIKLEGMRNELFRKRNLLDDMEKVAKEREERISALKAELRITKEGKIKAEDELNRLDQKLGQLEAEVIQKDDEVSRMSQELHSAQAEVRAAKGKARAKSSLLNAKQLEAEAAFSQLAEEKTNVTILTEALQSAKDRVVLLETENNNLKQQIDKYDRVSEWMRRRLGGENELVAGPSLSATGIKKAPFEKSASSLADLHAMISRLGMSTPGGPIPLSKNGHGQGSQSGASFSPIEPSDLPTPPQPTGLGQM